MYDHTVRDWRPVVEHADVPVLAVAGTHSPLWPADASRWIADAAPRGSYAELDAGHMPFVECAELFDEVLLDFIERSG